MICTGSIFLTSFFLFCSIILTLLLTAIDCFGKLNLKEFFGDKKIFFYQSFIEKIFPKKSWETLLFSIQFARFILYVLYALSILGLGIGCLIESNIFHALLGLLFFILLLIVDYCSSLIALRYVNFCIRYCSFPASLLLSVIFPFTYFFLIFYNRLIIQSKKELLLSKSFSMKKKLKQIIAESDLYTYLDAQDRTMLSFFLTFKEKVAREIMVPRVDMISLPSSMTLKEAAKVFLSEEYSRIPVYKDNMDNIIGVLMYKDVLKTYVSDNASLLEKPVESFIKSVIYAPENQTISHLFQELKTKQTHLAIIVNEYGGTEGIVTIEDVLEQLVGEIEDEYDIGEEQDFVKMPDNTYLVDGKMSILDLETQLDIKIPHSPQYETIGGYIFHLAGTIPLKGWILHHDDFELEIVKSTERCIEKVRIKPIKPV